MRGRTIFAMGITGLMGLTVLAVPAAAQSAAPAPDTRHSMVLFIADGLRANMVDDESAPNMARLAREGVRFENSHALFPTFTMPNASAFVTGHALGDTGTFGNTLYVGAEIAAANDSVTPFLEKDTILGEVDQKFGDNFLNEPSLFELARAKGYVTASIGKIGPALLFDHAEPDQSIVIDDATGTPRGVPLSDGIIDALRGAGLPVETPTRGENGRSGTKSANLLQQDYFAAATTRAVLPSLIAKNKPFLLVYWSRDPDGSQHYQGDSPEAVSPGINGPTSLAAIRNADDDLGRIRAALAELGRTETTDIVVVADHGFSTITKTIDNRSHNSIAADTHYEGVRDGTLPPGFLAIDLAHHLNLRLLDPDRHNAPVADGTYPKFDNAIIGDDAEHPKFVVAANGGSDLIYIPGAEKDPSDPAKGVSDEAKKRAGEAVDALLKQDYISGVFVRSDFGKFPGTLPMADIALEGDAATPKPAIVVSFRSFDASCSDPTRCTVEVADTTLKQGQGMHGSFSRADTFNFMAAAGPGFKTGMVDKTPASNADISRTIAHMLKLERKDKGKLVGRVLTEALARGGDAPEIETGYFVSEAGGPGNSLQTVVKVQKAAGICYFDAGGFPGRTVGLPPETPSGPILSPCAQ